MAHSRGVRWESSSTPSTPRFPARPARLGCSKEPRLDTERPVTLQDLLAHERFVRELSRRLLAQDSHEAEDLTQDVWSAALQHLPSNRNGLKAWLRAVVLALYSNRRRKRAPVVDEGIDQRARHEHSSSDQFEFDALRRWVAHAVHELREPYREVVLLRFYEALPPREVARRLGRPVQTVHTQTKRGLALVRQALQRDRQGDLRSVLLLLSMTPQRSKLERVGLTAAGAAGVVGAFVALRALVPAAAPAHAAPELLATSAPPAAVEDLPAKRATAASEAETRSPMLAALAEPSEPEPSA